MKKIGLIVVALVMFFLVSTGVNAAEKNCLNVHVHNGVISIPKGYTYVSGIKFQLKDSSGNIKDSWTTGDDYHKISNLNPGDYVLEVVSAPNNMVITKSFNITINENETTCSKIEIVAKAIGTPIATPCVYINIFDEATHIPTTASAQHLKGVSVQLKNSSGEVKDSWVTDGKAHLISALEPGDYLVEVIGVPSGYQKSQSTKITIHANDTGCSTKNIYVSKENTSNTQGSLQVYVYNKNSAQEDRNDVCSTGGSKHIYDETACLTKYDLYEGATIEITDSTGKVVSTWTSTNNDNPKVVNKLSVDSKYTVTVKSIKNGNLSKIHKGEVTIPSDGSAVVRFVIEEKTSLIKKVKVNVRCYDKSGDNFSSTVEFKILDKNGKEVETFIATGSTVKPIELEPGTYTLVEKSTPAGYTSDSVVNFTVSEDDSEITVGVGYDQIPETSDFNLVLLFSGGIICVAAVIFMFMKIRKQQKA